MNSKLRRLVADLTLERQILQEIVAKKMGSLARGANCLNEEVFFNLADARRQQSLWLYDDNHHRPHSALADRASTEFAAVCSGGNDGEEAALTLPLTRADKIRSLVNCGQRYFVSLLIWCPEGDLNPHSLAARGF